jgi:hypothetical protein
VAETEIIQEDHRPSSQKPAATVIKKKALQWWESPAGWQRKGLEQGMSIKDGEDISEFQCRVAARLDSPGGGHMSVLSDYQIKMIERLTPKDPNEKQQGR